MKALVIGNGAREHALAWALGAERKGQEIFCAPGNAGTAGIARNLPLDPQDSASIIGAVKELGIDLVVVGPEGPLASGLVDALTLAGIPAFGPGKKAAALEASKAQARAFCQRHSIPCATTAHFAPGQAKALGAFLEQQKGRRLVLKKSGLASGKGVVESDSLDELYSFGEAVLASDELLAEEFLVGQELSLFGLCTEKEWTLMEAAADHKKALPGDRGPNTGGMGAVSPLPFATPELLGRIEKEIVAPSFEAMASEGLAYRGVLFFGIMVTAEGPKLLEYNVRFGDPETQSLLPRLEGDFAELCAAIAHGRAIPKLSFSPRYSCGVVVAAPGYPISHSRGLPVDLSELGASAHYGRPEIDLEASPGEAGPKALLFQAATGRDSEGGLRTGGGRCFTAVGLGTSWSKAKERAYDLARRVHFEGAWFRPDIGEAIYRKK